ncbi:MAG: amidohydrolase family protein [Bacteroidota bacterium]
MQFPKTLISLFTLFALTSLIPAIGQNNYVIHCGTLIDGISNRPQKNMTIKVTGNTITGIESGYTTEPGSKVIDLTDHTIMPGLIDCHVHIEHEFSPSVYMERVTLNEPDVAFNSVSFADVTLNAGFTTVRDLGGRGVNTALGKATSRGKIAGPRVVSCNKSLAVTGGHADPTNGLKKELMGFPGPEQGVCDGVDECRKAVRHQVKMGADVIKITATGGVLSLARDGKLPAFREDEIRAIVETAADHGLKVAAHAHGDEGMQRAVRGGVASIEHGTMMSEETMDLMKEYGTYYVPTITAGKAVADSALVPGFYPKMVVPKALEIGPLIQSTFKKAYEKGVKIAFGTDAGVFPHGLNALEFIYMTEVGMAPMEAIQSATSVAADLLGMTDKIGSIEKGKLADLVAVKGDPLTDISLMMDIKFVMKDGNVYKAELE